MVSFTLQELSLLGLSRVKCLNLGKNFSWIHTVMINTSQSFSTAPKLEIHLLSLIFQIALTMVVLFCSLKALSLIAQRQNWNWVVFLFLCYGCVFNFFKSKWSNIYWCFVPSRSLKPVKLFAYDFLKT